MYTIVKGNTWLTTGVRAVGMLCLRRQWPWICVRVCLWAGACVCMYETKCVTLALFLSYEPHVMWDAVCNDGNWEPVSDCPNHLTVAAKLINSCVVYWQTYWRRAFAHLSHMQTLKNTVSTLRTDLEIIQQWGWKSAQAYCVSTQEIDKEWFKCSDQEWYQSLPVWCYMSTWTCNSIAPIDARVRFTAVTGDFTEPHQELGTCGAEEKRQQNKAKELLPRVI